MQKNIFYIFNVLKSMCRQNFDTIHKNGRRIYTGYPCSQKS